MPDTEQTRNPEPSAPTPAAPSASGAPSSGKEARWVAFGVLALLGLFSYLAFGRTPREKSHASGALRVENLRSSGGVANAQACAPSGGACQKLGKGGSVPAGSRLKTDMRTELSLTLGNGSRLVLGRGSELKLSADAGSDAELEHGSLLAEISREQGSLALALPHGSVSTKGAKFSAYAESDASRVEVTSGSVRVEDQAGHASPVRGGEVARFSKTRFNVDPATLLGSALAFGEDGEERALEQKTRGLGELSARKPGNRDELGGAVHLISHAVRVRIAGMMARTEVEEVFENRTGQQLEGVYRFPIPPNAQIEQLSLEVDGKWEDGAFVDRDRAAAIWNGAIVHAAPQARRLVDEIVWVPGPWRDPALLEWQRGGRFELRIFPIPARGQRRVKLRYSELVPAMGEVRRYNYALGVPAGSEPIRQFDVDVEVRGHDPKTKISVSGYELASRPLDSAAHYVYAARDFAPSGDLGVEYVLPDPRSEMRAFAYTPSAEAPTRTTSGFAEPPTSNDAYVAIALRPRLPAAEEVRARSLAIVVDSSHSMLGESYERSKRLAARLVRELDADDRVVVLACDSKCQKMPEAIEPGRAGERAAKEFLDSIQPGGASDPTRALSSAFRAFSETGDRDVRIVFISDGTPTVGPIRPAHVEAEIARELPAEKARVTTVAVGGEADTETLAALARGGGGVLVRYQPGQSVGEAAYAVLGASSGRALRDVEVTLPDGLYAVAPARLDAIPAGGEALIVARMHGQRVEGELAVRGRVGGRDFQQRYPLRLNASAAAASAFVPRLYAAARIVDLERAGGQESKREAIDLSTRFGVASRYTSLLVLESEAMFQAFGLKHAGSVGDWSTDDVAEGATAEAEAPVDEARDDSDTAALGAVEKKYDRAASGSGASGRAPANAYEAAPASDFAPAPAPAPAPAKARAKRAEESIEAERAAPAAKPASPPALAAAPQPLEPIPPPRMPLQVPPQRRMIPMRRIWERTAEITSGRIQPKAASFEALEQAEQKSLREPDHREPLKKLYSLLAIASDLGRAERVALRWSERDPLDADALTARADLAARRGDRTTAIRLLGSVIDARPGDAAAQRRLERLERWSGSPEAGCRHLVAAAELRQNDVKLLVDAVRCSRLSSDDIAVRELFASASEAARREAEAKLASPAPDDSLLNGDVTIQARFDGSEDLDISLIDPDGLRVSWLGAPTRAVIAARDVLARDREGLSLRGAKPGQYVVEVVRARPNGPTVTGELDIRAAGSSQRVPFTLSGARVSVALITVRMVPRLVPLR
ncbi:MAG: VIT domain-containing protein [Myxococcota bacterium]